MSRRAYLHGPAVIGEEDGAAAGFVAPKAVAEAAAPPVYSVLVRYEAPYRFEVPFTVTITQSGAVKFTRVYGRRSS